MAKKDVTIDAGLNISDITVSKRAEDRILRLRRELRENRAEYDSLMRSAGSAKTYGEKQAYLLGAREASHRVNSLSRRLGQTPSELMEGLTLTAAANQGLSANRKAEAAEQRAEERVKAAEERAQEKEKIRKQKEDDLYSQVTKAYKKLGDDPNTPTEQLQRTAIRTNARKLILDQWFGSGQLTPARYKKITEIYDKLSENTEVTGGLLSKLRENVAAGAGGMALGSLVSGRYGAILADREAPFSRMRDELNKGIKYAGGAIGAAIGGMAGPLGAAIGGAIGSFIGGAAEREKEASDSAKIDSIEMLRMRLLYGRGSFNSAMLAQNLGYMSYEDYTKEASNINIAPYAAAFGDITDRQWTGFAMLPNYMAARFSNASVEESLDALQADLSGMPLGLAQQAIGMLGSMGPSEAVRAFVMSPNYKRWIDAGGQLRDYDEALAKYAPAFEYAKMSEALKNRETRAKSIRKATRTGSKYNFDILGANEVESYYQLAKQGYTNKYGEEPDFLTRSLFWVLSQSPWFRSVVNEHAPDLTRRELVINIDNNRADLGTVYTFDGDWLQGATSYSVGSNQ